MKKHKPKVVKESSSFYNASAARQNFFSILETAAAGDLSSPVIVRHKDLPDDIAIVNARELGELMQLLKALQEKPVSARKFRLFGSAIVHGDVEEILAEIRAEDNAAYNRKIESF